MKAAEFENLRDRYWDDGGHNFRDYKPGDVIVIRDTILRMSVDYDPQWGVVTHLWFESTGKGDNDLIMTFDADLEGDYHVGDTVSITLHVDEESRTHDEVIRELNNNLTDTSNIDQTISADIVFYAIVVIGAFLVFIYMLFTHKVRRVEAAEASGSMEREIEEEITEDEGWAR